MATTTNKRKKAVAATVAAAAILLGGTFAWTSISQQALNESAGVVNVGGRLHDDFNGENKDVYVENFTDPLDGGQPIYARVKLTEYMEVGQDAGSDTDLDSDGMEAIPVIDGTSRDNPDTWKIHNPTGETDEDGATCTICDLGTTHTIHDHWKWTMGGETTYMPTFNKDKDSLEADTNGTYDGIDENDKIYYDDYVTYTSDKTVDGVGIEVPETDIESYDNPIYSVEGTEYYDDDTDTAENDHKNETGVRVERDVVHTAKETVNASVITMTEWEALPEDQQVGNYWVYDNDGWAYWAAPIMPGEATGLLLDKIEMTKNPGEKCYYAINVVAQFATVDDWSKFHPDNGTSEESDVSEDAEALLEKAAASVPKVTVTNTSQKTTIDVTDGEDDRTVTFSADTFIGTSTDAVADSYTWELYNADLEPVKSTITDDGELTVSLDETNESLIVAARSADYPGAVGLSSVAIKLNKGDVNKLPMTLSREDGCRYIKQGEATSVTASLPDGVSADDVTFTVDGITGGYEIDRNGDTATVTVDDTIPVGTWITVKAASSKAEGSLELVVVTDNELQFYQEGVTYIAPSIDGTLKISEVYDETMTTEGMPLAAVFASEFVVFSTTSDMEVNLFSATGHEPIVTLVDKTSANTRLEDGRLYVGEDEQGVTLRVILADADMSSLGVSGISILYVDGETTFTLEEPPEPLRLYIKNNEGTKCFGTAASPYVVSASTEEQKLTIQYGNNETGTSISDLFLSPTVSGGPYVEQINEDLVPSSRDVIIPANAPTGTYTITLEESGSTENETFVFVIQ